MTKNTILNTIKNKEMDRKDFLKYSGFILASLVGLKAIIAILSQDHHKITVVKSDNNSPRGFGGGKYGS